MWDLCTRGGKYMSLDACRSQSGIRCTPWSLSILFGLPPLLSDRSHCVAWLAWNSNMTASPFWVLGPRQGTPYLGLPCFLRQGLSQSLKLDWLDSELQGSTSRDFCLSRARIQTCATMPRTLWALGMINGWFALQWSRNPEAGIDTVGTNKGLQGCSFLQWTMGWSSYTLYKTLASWKTLTCILGCLHILQDQMSSFQLRLGTEPGNLYLDQMLQAKLTTGWTSLIWESERLQEPETFWVPSCLHKWKIPLHKMASYIKLAKAMYKMTSKLRQQHKWCSDPSFTPKIISLLICKYQGIKNKQVNKQIPTCQVGHFPVIPALGR